VTCVLPLAVLSAEKLLDPLYTNELPLELKVVAATPDPHVSLPLTIPQVPFEDVRVKLLLEPLAVNDAQVPDVYQVPALMIQPFCEPEATTFRYPLPEKAPPVEVGAAVVVVLVPVGVVELPLGRYLIPVLGHDDEVSESVA